MRAASAKLHAHSVIITLCFFAFWGLGARTLQSTPTHTTVPTLHGVYFTETGCNHCDTFLYVQKQNLEQKYHVRLELEKHDILSSEGYSLCVKMLRQKHLKFTVFPVLFIGSNIYRGSSAIETNIVAEIEYYVANGTYLPTKFRSNELAAEEEQRTRALGTSLLPTLFAGLLDGINPCAFSTMLFFLSFMALRRTGRRSQFFVGLAFIAAVFFAYFLIGFGLLGALREFLSAQRFSRYIAGCVSFLSIIFAALNLRDARTASRGAASESVLQLPMPLKRLSHRVIRHFNTVPLYILGAAVSGFLVSFIELACTGQIYFPTIAYLNQSVRSSASIALLFAYNVAFITPLCVVFALCVSGTRQERIRIWYGSHLVLVRVLSALFFVALGILVWIV